MRLAAVSSEFQALWLLAALEVREGQMGREVRAFGVFAAGLPGHGSTGPLSPPPPPVVSVERLLSVMVAACYDWSWTWHHPFLGLGGLLNF